METLIRTVLGQAILSFVERLSSFRGDNVQSVYTKRTFDLSSVWRFVLFRSVLYQRFHCNYMCVTFYGCPMINVRT